ncbi:MAG: hypothetical protein K0S32_3570 [Bacteroidetes bacterium]|jgi:hypothetical protein|nr:hypothetical protein [Bacteroidota bacterium]
MSENETSPSGNPIYRYDNVKKNEFEIPHDQGGHLEEITKHIETHVGKIEGVYHEMVSDQVHIDVHWVKPSEEFPFHVLITSGMSDKAMTVPAGLDDHKYAELCMLLPEDWKLSLNNEEMTEIFKDEANYWPIRWLKKMARFPHEYNTWLGWGHSIPNGEKATPFAHNTGLGCLLLLPAFSLPPDFFELKLKEKTIKFYCLWPIYKAEMELKLNEGSEALIDRFEECEVFDVVDIYRENTCE